MADGGGSTTLPACFPDTVPEGDGWRIQHAFVPDRSPLLARPVRYGGSGCGLF